MLPSRMAMEMWDSPPKAPADPTISMVKLCRVVMWTALKDPQQR